MNGINIDIIKLIFLLGFTLHNFEEAVWLPRWSKFAKKYHEPVKSDPFVFAVIVITIVGYILTGLDIILGDIGSILNYAYLGFVGMMGLNAIVPHLISTIALKKYSPGLITGVLLNMPLSMIIIVYHINGGVKFYYLIMAIITVAAVTLLSLKPLFKLGEKLVSYDPRGKSRSE